MIHADFLIIQPTQPTSRCTQPFLLNSLTPAREFRKSWTNPRDTCRTNRSRTVSLSTPVWPMAPYKPLATGLIDATWRALGTRASGEVTGMEKADHEPGEVGPLGILTLQ